MFFLFSLFSREVLKSNLGEALGTWGTWLPTQGGRHTRSQKNFGSSQPKNPSAQDDLTGLVGRALVDPCSPQGLCNIFFPNRPQSQPMT